MIRIKKNNLEKKSKLANRGKEKRNKSREIHDSKTKGCL